MKALILYLKEVPHTLESAKKAKESAEMFNVDAKLYAGYVPSRANAYIKEHKLGFYDPGPKLYKIKNKKGGVRGCMISHLTMWEEVVRRNETTIIMEHDAIMVSSTWDQPFDDVLHLDAHRFDIDHDAGTEPQVVQWTYGRKGEIQFKGTYGYVIKPHAAQKLINAAYTDGITASDMFMKQRYINLQLAKPRAVYVASKQSLSSDRDFDM